MTSPHTLTLRLHGDRSIVMTRLFDAPRTLVFDAWTEPELVKRWLAGPPGNTLETCEIDLRPGGRLRYVWRLRDGPEMGMSGEYREVVRPERFVHTELFDEDWTGGEAILTAELTEQEGRTTITMTVEYASAEARDAVLETGMQGGMASSFDALDQVLASLG